MTSEHWMHMCHCVFAMYQFTRMHLLLWFWYNVGYTLSSIESYHKLHDGNIRYVIDKWSKYIQSVYHLKLLMSKHKDITRWHIHTTYMECFVFIDNINTSRILIFRRVCEIIIHLLHVITMFYAFKKESLANHFVYCV